MRAGATFGRRSFLNLIGTSGVTSVQVFGKQDSWQLKSPSEWSPDEVNWILNDSPWVQSAEVFFSRSRGAKYPLETPQLLRNPPKFMVRWESAQPVLDALKLPRPSDFRDSYALHISDNRWFRRELKPPRFPESLSALKGATGLKFK